MRFCIFLQNKNFGGFLPLRNVYELTNFQVLFFSFAIVGVAQSMFALYSGLALYAFSTAFVVPCLTTLVSQVGKLKTSVADPNPDTDPPDPHVFGPSGSISQRYGSGSFYHHAKIVRKTLMSTIL